MFRRYILFGFMATMFLPAFIKAAEYKPEAEDKHVILIVEINLNQPSIVPYIQKLVGKNFKVIQKKHNMVYDSDLTDVQYIIVSGICETAKSLADIPGLLSDNVMGFPNKILIALRYETWPQLAINDAINELFNKNVFQLNYRQAASWQAGAVVVENERFAAFGRRFLTILSQQKAPNVKEVGTIPGPFVQELGTIPGPLQQMIDALAHDLSAANSEVERLRQENIRLNVQVAAAISVNRRLNDKLSEIVRRLAEQGL